MAEYARREGFDADAAYRWRRVLRRTGQWLEADGTPAVGKAAAVKKRKASGAICPRRGEAIRRSQRRRCCCGWC